jgi:hypothetical protein
MILSGFARQMKGSGFSLVSARKRLMAAWRSTRDRKLGRHQEANQTSPELAFDQLKKSIRQTKGHREQHRADWTTWELSEGSKP